MKLDPHIIVQSVGVPFSFHKKGSARIHSTTVVTVTIEGAGVTLSPRAQSALIFDATTRAKHAAKKLKCRARMMTADAYDRWLEADRKRRLVKAKLRPADRRYIERLMASYPDCIYAGYDFAMQVARDVAAGRLAKDASVPTATARQLGKNWVAAQQVKDAATPQPVEDSRAQLFKDLNALVQEAKGLTERTAQEEA